MPHLGRSSRSVESRRRIGRPMQCERWPACHDHTFNDAAPVASKEDQAVLAATVAATASNPDTAPLPVEVVSRCLFVCLFVCCHAATCDKRTPTSPRMSAARSWWRHIYWAIDSRGISAGMHRSVTGALLVCWCCVVFAWPCVSCCHPV